MSQNPVVIADGTGATVLNELNLSFDTVMTLNSGPAAPATTYPFMFWADTTNNRLKQRNAANTAWNTLAVLGSDYFGLLSSVNAYSKQQYFAEQALTDGATINWDLDSAQSAYVTIAGNRALANPTNMHAGSSYKLRVIQDGTGGRSLSFGSAFKWVGNVAPDMSTAPGAVTIFGFDCDGVYMYGAARQY